MSIKNIGYFPMFIGLLVLLSGCGQASKQSVWVAPERTFDTVLEYVTISGDKYDTFHGVYERPVNYPTGNVVVIEPEITSDNETQTIYEITVSDADLGLIGSNSYPIAFEVSFTETTYNGVD